MARNEARARDLGAAKKDISVKVHCHPVIEEALRLACMHTHQLADQDNLEFMARYFLSKCSPPSRLPAVGLPNSSGAGGPVRGVERPLNDQPSG